MELEQVAGWLWCLRTPIVQAYAVRDRDGFDLIGTSTAGQDDAIPAAPGGIDGRPVDRVRAYEILLTHGHDDHTVRPPGWRLGPAPASSRAATAALATVIALAFAGCGDDAEGTTDATVRPLVPSRSRRGSRRSSALCWSGRTADHRRQGPGAIARQARMAQRCASRHDRPMRIIVVGAGIGGLSAAIGSAPRAARRQRARASRAAWRNRGRTRAP
jgi:hypothetical protein